MQVELGFSRSDRPETRLPDPKPEEAITMRFMMIVKADKDTQAGVMPDEKRIATMVKHNEELAKAGVLLDLSGLQEASANFRILD
jgi:hypothetical protein